VDQESVVFILAEHLLQKGGACAAFLVKQPLLAWAGVHQKSYGERQVGVFHEVFDRLRTPVFFEVEVGLGQVIRDMSFFIAHGGEHVDDVNLRRKRGQAILGSQTDWGEQPESNSSSYTYAGEHLPYRRAFQRKVAQFS
jgi:hypothetical protein